MKTTLSVRNMVLIALFTAIAFVLNSIKLFTMPYGGSVSLCSMMPILLLAILLGNKVWMLGGAALGVLSIINCVYVIHPVQFLLDYLLPYMCLGMAGFGGCQDKRKVFVAALFAVTLNVTCHVLSGVVYFGSYAPEGMSPWVYSLVYNLLTSGIEGAFSIAVLLLLPLHRFADVVNRSR